MDNAIMVTFNPNLYPVLEYFTKEIKWKTSQAVRTTDIKQKYFQQKM
jgi:hypothetical protein